MTTLSPFEIVLGTWWWCPFPLGCLFQWVDAYVQYECQTFFNVGMDVCVCARVLLCASAILSGSPGSMSTWRCATMVSGARFCWGLMMESPICGLKTTWTSSLLSSCSCILDEFRMAGRRRLIHGQVYCRFIPSGGSSDLHCVCVWKAKKHQLPRLTVAVTLWFLRSSADSAGQGRSMAWCRYTETVALKIQCMLH